MRFQRQIQHPPEPNRASPSRRNRTLFYVRSYQVLCVVLELKELVFFLAMHIAFVYSKPADVQYLFISLRPRAGTTVDMTSLMGPKTVLVG